MWAAENELMKIPLYWSRGIAEEIDARGKTVAFSCWRSSDESPETARETALSAAKRILRDKLSGKKLEHYGYGVTTREPVIEKFTDTKGEMFAAVTRTAYGALVLNTAKVLFADIDYPFPSPGDKLRFLWAKITFRTPNETPESRIEHETYQKARSILENRPSWNFRIYRTLAGLRLMATHDLFAPSSAETLDLLQSLDADPLYVKLCQRQDCFRARLTPKPWRCGINANHIPWPIESQENQDRFDAWLLEYMNLQTNFATCRYVESIGNGKVHPEAETILEVHDKFTRCDESLELA